MCARRWGRTASLPGGQVPGRKGARARPPGRELTHLGEEVVHCSPCAPQLAQVRLPALAEVNAAQGPGEPCVSRRDSQKLEPAGFPRCHLRLPLLGFRTFCLPKPQSLNASVPTAAFVSSGSKFLTPGRSARERRTAGGTFFPRAGGGRRGAAGECAPLPLRSGPRRLGRAGEQRPQSEPRRWLSRLERRGGEDSGARVSPAHGHTETRGQGRTASPALSSGPAHSFVSPRPRLSPAHSAGPPEARWPRPTPPGAPPSARPSPRFRQVRPRPAGATRPQLRSSPAHSAPRAAAGLETRRLVGP